MDDLLTDRQASDLVLQTMKGSEWGWSLPGVGRLLMKLHAGIDGNENCGWRPVTDLNRWECECGHTARNIPLQVASGAWRN